MNSEPTELESQKPARARFKKRWIFWTVFALAFVPYFYFRATSFSRKIIVVENTAAEKSHVFDGALTIATWNIAHGRGATDDNWEEGKDAKEYRITEIAQQIKEFDADIVVLNEVDFSATWSGGFDQATAIAQAAGYPYYVKQSNLDFGLIYGRWHFGNVVMSRFPIKDASELPLTPVNQWEDWVVGCKRGVSCNIDLTDDKQISLIGVHLEARGEAVRVHQVDDVAAACSQFRHPIFLAGDLNTTPPKAPYSNTNAEGKNAFAELTAQSATGLTYSPGAVPVASDLTYPSDKPKSVIDWILYDESEFTLQTQTVFPTLLSDHLPVVAKFRERQSQTR